MIYDYSFKTGVGFSGLYSPVDQENIKEVYSQGVHVSSADITGINSTRLSLNGQTLLEQTARLVDVGFEPVYLNSGDYYFRSGESYRDVNFSNGLSPAEFFQNDLFYQIRDNKTEAVMGSGISTGVMKAQLTGELSKKFAARTGSLTGMASFDYFLNGQKIYTGIGGSYRISGASSEFYYNENITGKLFAIPKNTGIDNYTGFHGDVYARNFVESTVFGYFDGLALNRINWLELHTGVNLIKTGVQAMIFDPAQTRETISL